MSTVKVIDGGFSTQLSTHVSGEIDGDPLWTARYLSTDPDAVFSTHLDFLRAGSDIILTNTYQASVDGFVKYLGITEAQSLNLFRQAVNCAKKAVNVYMKEISGDKNVINRNPLISGSCGPYGASLHDGSEYTGSYAPKVSKTMLMDWHRPHLKTLIESGVDLIALETIPCKIEAEALVNLLKEFPNIKAWLSFSCRCDGKSIVDGSNFQEVATSCYRNALPGQILAVGINCIAPQCATALLKGINTDRTKDFVPLVLYPNSGETYTVQDGWTSDGECHSLHEFIEEWLDLGVQYIGGCCRTSAVDIQRIRAKVEERKAKGIV